MAKLHWLNWNQILIDSKTATTDWFGTNYRMSPKKKRQSILTCTPERIDSLQNTSTQDCLQRNKQALIRLLWKIQHFMLRECLPCPSLHPPPPYNKRKKLIKQVIDCHVCSDFFFFAKGGGGIFVIQTKKWSFQSHKVWDFAWLGTPVLAQVF